jgi:succinate-semialdehyde dehydrogenase/glutarate-semialdehyde dehydrogenase
MLQPDKMAARASDPESMPMQLSLKDPSLLRERMFIDGRWTLADDGATFEVRNPSTGQLIRQMPAGGAKETQRAIAAAERALKSWRPLLAKERSKILRRLYDLMMANVDDLALILTAEQGKPLAEARAEIIHAASFIEWYSEEAKRAYGEIIPQNVVGRRILVQKAPIGVFAAITPWNFPAAMITRKAGAGWAAGCAGIIKPAEETPLSALAFAALAERAGLPAGVCNVVTGRAAEIGAALTQSEVVRKLTFTGSTEVGALLLAQCATTIKKTSMELGGNAPFIVFEDADIEAAVEGAIAAKYRNSGQTCIAANRFLVHASIHEEFASRLADASSRLCVGDGMMTGVDVGPLISDEAIRKIERHVTDALSRGARLTSGGKRHALGQRYYEPTVLSHVPRDALIFREETFGPVAPLFTFKSEEEAIELANDTRFGLAAYIFARDVGRIFRVIEALEFGMIGVNEGLISSEVVPFGGVKASGHGREGSRHGLDEYLEMKYVALGGLAN